MRTHLPLLIVLALTAAGCAVSPTSSNDVVIGEKLIAQPPTDWQNIYSLNNGTTRLTDFIPPEETKNNWSTKISFESHKSLADVDPITIVMGDLDHTSDTCEAVQSFNLFSGVENNYPTSVRLTFCGKNAHSQQGEVSMTKSIQGNEYLYIIKMLTRVEPFVTEQSSITKQQIAVWSQYFSDISVCDDTSQEHACPAPAEP